MILVTGATGNVGRQVVSQLVAGGAAIRALTRDPDSAHLAEGVSIVGGDLSSGSADAIPRPRNSGLILSCRATTRWVSPRPHEAEFGQRHPVTIWPRGRDSRTTSSGARRIGTWPRAYPRLNTGPWGPCPEVGPTT